MEKIKLLENDLTVKIRQVNEFEIRLEEMKQNFKQVEQERRESFDKEK